MHPNLVRLEAVHETDDMTWLVMEELAGGELFDHLVQRRRFREAEAADIAWQVLMALACLHGQCVAHRDLKPENVVFVEQGCRALKLIDFGFAARVDGDGLTRQCGSLGYVAPEVLSGRKYDERCDLWSMGSLLYTLMTGRPLFSGSQEEVLARTKTYRQPEFGMEFWCLSEDAQDLIRALLHANPARRLSAEQALQHPWFLGAALMEVGRGASASSPFIAEVLAAHES